MAVVTQKRKVAKVALTFKDGETVSLSGKQAAKWQRFITKVINAYGHDECHTWTVKDRILINPEKKG